MRMLQEGTIHIEVHARVPNPPIRQELNNAVNLADLITQADAKIHEIAIELTRSFGGTHEFYVDELRKVVETADQITQDQSLVNIFTRPPASNSAVGDYPGQLPAFRNRRPKRL